MSTPCFFNTFIKNTVMQRPSAGEYAPYFQRYIDLVPDGDFPLLFRDNKEETTRFFESIPPEKHDHRYADGKWTIKEVLMHIIDTERVMSNRAFVAARADSTTVLHPMDENQYAANAAVSGRGMASIIAEFIAVRNATLALYEPITDAQSRFMARGETHPFTARALGYIMIGHTEHHFKVIKERYL